MSPSVCPRPAQPFRGCSSACNHLFTLLTGMTSLTQKAILQHETLNRRPSLRQPAAYKKCELTRAAHHCIASSMCSAQHS